MLQKSFVRNIRFFSSTRLASALRPFVLADVGEGIKECEVIQWLVQPGARVEEFDPICELQSDKASVEITSRYEGVIKKLHYEVGQMAQVGTPLLDIDVLDEQDAASDAATAPNVEATPTTVVNSEIPSHDSDKIGAEHSTPAQLQSQPAPTPVSIPVSSPGPVSRDASIRTLATPAVRRICKELGIDISNVNGSGKQGRVLKDDVAKFAEGRDTKSEATSLASSLPAFTTSSPQVEHGVVPLKGVPKMMFKTMTESAQIPHFVFADEIEMDQLMAMRARINKHLEPKGVKLSFMPFLIKALSIALKEHPIVNSRLLPGEQSLEMRPIHNVSVAMATPHGLLVPSIKNVNGSSIFEIGQELLRLQEASQSGKLQQSDLTDGTITLSNIGTVGGTYLAPVIVDGQVAIGGVGSIRKLPRFDENDNIVARHIMCTSWSGDHRALDGMTLATLVTRWKQLIENPEDMLLNMY